MSVCVCVFAGALIGKSQLLPRSMSKCRGRHFKLVYGYSLTPRFTSTVANVVAAAAAAVVPVVVAGREALHNGSNLQASQMYQRSLRNL